MTDQIQVQRYSRRSALVHMARSLAAVPIAGALMATGAGEAAAAPQLVAYGAYFDQVKDAKGWHHYVTFFIKPARYGNWQVVGPVGTSSPMGGTNPKPWPQRSPNYVQAGFHFPDGVNPYLFRKPSEYRLYSV